VARFERIVAQSDWRFASFDAVPIRKLRRFHNRLTREFTTATVRCRLVPKEEAPVIRSQESAISNQ
jgi:hypothetical protein